MILVTGATGFLGHHVLRVLRHDPRFQSEPVRLLVRRPTKQMRARGYDLVRGSVTDKEAVETAVAGCRYILHLAGKVSRSAADAPEMMQLHVDGTRLLCDAARSAKVERVVIASTSGTIAVADEPVVLDENAASPLERVRHWPYYLSKIFEESVVMAAVRCGLPAIILNPTLLLGPGDRRLSSTGDVLRILDGEMQSVPRGGMSAVDVRDAASAFFAALTRGTIGGRYLLTAKNLTCADFARQVAQIAKIPAPTMRLPSGIERWTASLIEDLAAVRNRAPSIDRVTVEMAQAHWYCDASKAQRELGFSPRDFDLTLRETIEWLRAHRRRVPAEAPLTLGSLFRRG